jgi:hypothetical protein
LDKRDPVWSFQFIENYAEIETGRVAFFFRVTASLSVVIAEGEPVILRD